MKAYKKTLTIENPQRVVLSDLPFEAGQRVEVLVIAEEDQPATNLARLQALLKKTQALPQARSMSEEEIAAEVAAYRAGR